MKIVEKAKNSKNALEITSEISDLGRVASWLGCWVGCWALGET